MDTTTTVTVSAKSYEDADDCLSAAAAEYADDHDLGGWQVTAAWVGGEDGDREEIELTVPAGVQCECGRVLGERCQWTGPVSETVTLEWIPEHLRASHEAAGNRGVHPHNGAERLRCERSCAERIVADDGDWSSIVEVRS